jgi:hypothetical protein
MPGLAPQQPSAPYPTVKQVLQLTRAFCLDAGISIDGDLLSDTSTYTYPLLQSAYENVQDELANHGYETPTKEAILLNVTAVPSAVQNPGTQVYIGYDQYFDGQNQNNAPLLPQDLLAPVRLWERPNGSILRFAEMDPANDGLDSLPQYLYLRQWEWRDDKIYLIGATQALDVRMRYKAYFPVLTKSGDVIKIFHGANAVAYDCAIKFSGPRAGEAVSYFETERDKSIKQIVTRIAQKNQRKNIRPRPYGAMGMGRNY